MLLHDDVLLRAQQPRDRVVAFLSVLTSLRIAGGVLGKMMKWFLALNVVVTVLEERLDAEKEFR